MSGSIGLKRLLQQVPSVRAVLFLSFMMILATVVSVMAVLLDLRQKELTHAKGELVSLTRILSEQTTRTFEGVVLTMRGVRERLSDDLGRTFELSSVPVRLLLQARSAGLPQVKSLFVIDSQGFGVNSSRADFIPRLPMSNREPFRYFIDGGSDEIFISRPEKARVDGQWTYYAGIRLLDGTGQFRGVLVASISIGYFESLYESIGLDFVSRIRLLNRDGVLMAGKPHDETMFGKIDGNPAALAKLGVQPEGGVVETSEELSEGRRFVAYRQVANYPLVISAAVDEEEALTPWFEVTRPIIAGVFLVLLFISVTTLLMVRSLLRKDALESALKKSDEQLRHMVQSARDAIVTANSARRVVLFNGAAEEMLGIQAHQAIGSEIGELLSRCLHQSQLVNLLRDMEEGWHSSTDQTHLSIVELRRDEQESQVEVRLSTTTFRGEALLTAVFRDLTERQRAERELLETNRQLQELSASLQNIREEERTRISRELHDELGQLLTGIKMEVSWLGGRLLPEQQALIGKVLSVKGQIDQTIASVRRISSELRPLVLDDLGFDAAAAWYVNQFSERTGLPVNLVISPADPEYGEAVATTLFRVLQESLTNVARHANATKVEVRLSYMNEGCVLSIKDDGIGFMHDPGRRGDIGLVGMRERVQRVNGRFTVTTAPGEGTLIEVAIPAQPAQKTKDG